MKGLVSVSRAPASVDILDLRRVRLPEQHLFLLAQRPRPEQDLLRRCRRDATLRRWALGLIPLLMMKAGYAAIFKIDRGACAAPPTAGAGRLTHEERVRHEFRLRGQQVLIHLNVKDQAQLRQKLFHSRHCAHVVGKQIRHGQCGRHRSPSQICCCCC